MRKIFIWLMLVVLLIAFAGQATPPFRDNIIHTNSQQNDLITLPVVFHLLHYKNADEITLAKIEAILQSINDGFANRNEYDQGSGVDTRIQFCLAKRDPDGNATTGLNKVYADFPKFIPDIHTQQLAGLVNWDVNRYINIYVVDELEKLIEFAICDVNDLMAGGVSIAGTGVVIDRKAFAPAVAIHELGHYLGLAHPFDGGCANTDCTNDGDGMCDTPPQLIPGAKCDGSSNTCDTDSQSGFATDQNDAPANFMDYGSCPHDFTEDQKNRMRATAFTINNPPATPPLCEALCALTASADFSFERKTYRIGDAAIFLSTSAAASYQWLVNGQMLSNAATFTYQFLRPGWFKIELLSGPPGGGACQQKQVHWIRVYCGVRATISKSKIKVSVDEAVQLSATVQVLRPASGSVSYRWYFNGKQVADQQAFTHRFKEPGKYTVVLLTQLNDCIDTAHSELIIVAPLPDYSINLQKFICTPSATSLQIKVCNEDFKQLEAGFPIAFYQSNPLTGPAVLWHLAKTTKAVGRFCCDTMEIPLPQNKKLPGGGLFVVINDNGTLARPYSWKQFPLTSFAEQKYENNIDSLRRAVDAYEIVPKDTTIDLGNSFSYGWSPANPYKVKWVAQKGRFDCDTCITSSFTPTNSGWVMAHLTDEDGCRATDTGRVVVLAKGDIYIPTAFTPNADGRNDVFYIMGGYAVKQVRKLEIFNRWGQRVFRQELFLPNRPERGWDGRLGGSPAPVAVYVYYLAAEFLDGRTQTYRGTLTLLRW